MLFKGTLQTCIDHLARIDSSLWSDIFVLIHVPAWHCYAAMPVDEYAVISMDDATPINRLLFSGSITEMAHFVLCPPLTHHATRQTLAELPDNTPPLLKPGDPGAARLDPRNPDNAMGEHSISETDEADRGGSS